MVIVSGVEVDKVGEEAAGSHFASELIEVIVGIAGLVAHTGFLFPDLDGEDSCGAVAHALIGRVQQLTDDATSLGTGVGSIIDRAEHHLVAAARVNRVHVMDKRLHRLMNTAHRLVHGVLQDALIALQKFQLTLNIVVHLHVIQAAVVRSHESLEVLHLLDEGAAHIWGQIEVKRWNCLSAVHLVLGGFHRDARNHAGSLDALGGTRFAVPGHITLLKHLVQRMLHAGEALGGVVVLVVDVQVVAAHGLARLLAQEIIIDKGLGGLTGKLHHHAGRSVGIHVGILTSNVVVLGIDNLQEQVARLGFTGHTALLAIIDIAARHLLARTLHQLQLHLVLNVLDAHLATTSLANTVSDALNESFIFTGFGGKHRLTDCRLDFLFIVADDAAITFKNSLNHILFIKKKGFSINCYR